MKVEERTSKKDGTNISALSIPISKNYIETEPK